MLTNPIANAIARLALVAFVLTPIIAQSSPSQTGGTISELLNVTADQILAKYENALGGAAALAKITTRTVRSRRFQDIGPPRTTISCATRRNRRQAARASRRQY